MLNAFCYFIFFYSILVYYRNGSGHSFGRGKNIFNLSVKIWMGTKLPFSCDAHTLTEWNVRWQRAQYRLSHHNDCLLTSIGRRCVSRFIRSECTSITILYKISFCVRVFGGRIGLFGDRSYRARSAFPSQRSRLRCARVWVAMRIRTASHLALTFAL